MRQALPWLLLVLLVVFVAYKLRTSHFDWAGFVQSFRTANFKLLALGIAVIQVNYFLRAMRWAIFLKPAERASGQAPVRWTKLVGPQFVGFTGLAIFGRIGELIRPLLVARKTGLTFSSQIAVVAVERIFDLGAFALIFSLNLLLSPALRTLPHHELFHRVGYAIAGMTVIVAVFVLAVRLSGPAVARATEWLIGRFSKRAAATAAAKVLAFRDGLNVIDSFADFVLASVLSIALWLSIAVTYVLVVKAFPAPVNQLTAAHAILLLGFSVVGSVVQLPGVGGGAQAMTIGALTQLFNIPNEAAVGAGLMIWLASTMSVIPFGLIAARMEGVSIRQVTRSSEEAETTAS